jgi:GT2 family glycosyltransferase
MSWANVARSRSKAGTSSDGTSSDDAFEVNAARLVAFPSRARILRSKLMLQTETSIRDSRRAASTERTSGRPVVSVVIPAYNSANFIGETLDSVFAQTFADYEVIVVNDGSPDTLELERVLALYMNRIVYLKQENSGPARARNEAIARAAGEYVAFLDSDDLWTPEYLAAQVRALNDDASLALVCADAELFGESIHAGQTFMQRWPSEEPVTFEKLLSMECAIITMCVVARKQALIDAGLFDERFVRSEDYDLWLRLAQRGARFAYQHRVLGHRRLHGASLASNEQALFESQIEVYQKLLATLELSPDERRAVERQIERSHADLALHLGKREIMAGEYAQAAEALTRANLYYHSHKLKLALISLRLAPRLLRRVYHLYQRLLMRGMTVAV